MSTTLAESTGALAPGIRFTMTGLHIPPGLAFETWECLIAEMAVYERGFRFWWGDALNYGEHEYGQKYAQAVELTGLSYETLADYCHVARNVPFSLRNEKLSWSHHKVVARLTHDRQRHWLAWAAKTNKTVNELRQVVSFNEPALNHHRLSWSEPVELSQNGHPSIHEVDDDEPPTNNEPYYAESDRADHIAWLVCPHCGKEFAA